MNTPDLVIKITERCNFACTFCSSSDISNSDTELDLEGVFTFLKAFPLTSTVIVNGGDPLVVSPSIYQQILKFLDENEMETKLGLVSNLWDFYKNPLKWKEVFDHPKVTICTSFNYGDARRISKEEVFTEELFLEITDMMKERHPDKRLFFIGVIDEDNLDTVIDMARLAKRIDIPCRANRIMKSGKAMKALPIGTICKEYVKICEEGLSDWEKNTEMILNVLRHKKGVVGCPLNRDCDQGIRCLQPDGYYACPAWADEKKHKANYEEEIKAKELSSILPEDLSFTFLKPDCLSCPAYNVCNGCKKHIEELKESDQVERNCNDMREALPSLLKYAYN